MARKTKAYTEKDIQVLSDREHVRLRTQIYLGNTHLTSYTIPLLTDKGFTAKEVEFVPAVYKAVGEIIDNCIDEFAQINQKNKVLKIVAEPERGKYTIADNGRGIPISKHETGKYTPEVAVGSLRAGRNFGNDKDTGVIGQNGVGSACTNFCSSTFEITINRENKKYVQKFTNGADKVGKPSIRAGSSKTGTQVSFELDEEVFKNVSIPSEMMLNRAKELAFTNPGIVVEYNNEKFKYKKGLEDVVASISNKYFKFEFEQQGLVMEFFVVFDVNKTIDEQMFTWVNSSLLFDGGLCNTQFLNAFVDKTVDHLKSSAKKQKCEVTKNDVRSNLLVLANMKVANPEYDAQSKTRLTGPNLRKEMADMLTNGWSSFSRRNKEWLTDVLDRAMVRHHASANSKAIKEHTKTLNKKVPGLIDATSKIRFNCQLLITEGLSAASMITDARDPNTTGIFPLTGKINNVYGMTVAQLLNAGKLTTLLAAVGLVPGQKVSRGDLRFGKIVIATDADNDGSDIFTLLINLFYQFWPELFDKGYEPVVHRLVAPNICAVKGKTRIHFVNRDDFEKQKDKYKGWTITYYKGLGSMEREDWDMILSGKTNTLIPIVDDGNMKDTLELLFGPSADSRKDWLQSET